MLALLRQHYWIVGARNAIRAVLKECALCRRINPNPISQKMGSMPDDRITPGMPPFSFVGVDLFGPFIIKRGRSELKRYVALFTCLGIRAVHIEVVNTLETDSFIQALIRFTCRRGNVRLIRSDNGTNFVGAASELKVAVDKLNQSTISDFLSKKSVQWKFNPPSASHMVGVWERQIRSVRKILAAVMREQPLDDERLATFMCIVESIINSRPITTVSEDPRVSRAINAQSFVATSW